MSENRLPKSIDARRSAEQGLQLTGIMPLNEMSRLVTLLAAVKDKAKVTINCGIDSEGWPYLKGKINVGVQLQCQRCLQPYDEQINTEFSLVPIANQDEAQLLPKHYEELLVANQSVDLATLIEDELLLSLPIVPRHRNNECLVQVSYPPTDGLVEMPRPFSALAKLKHNSRS